MTPHKCPVCAGTGKVSKPPNIAGDIQTWEGSGTTSVVYPCQACNGTGIVWEPEELTILLDEYQRAVNSGEITGVIRW